MFVVVVMLSSCIGLQPLLHIICCIVLYSSFLSSLFKGYVISRLARYLIAEVLCSCGWFESCGMMRSVVAGFL